jgi:transketolase
MEYGKRQKERIMNKAIMESMRKKIITTVYQGKEGHIPSALSILDIVWVLHEKVMMLGKDRFVLSKGQAGLALYIVLAQLGHISEKELIETYCQYDSKFGGHPDRLKSPYVEASTGSLGHGMPMAVGIALANKVSKNHYKTFCLIGDGEANEGTIWESALLAPKHNLSNLCCIVDYNHSTDRALNMGDMGNKFKSFGWKVVEVNGHDQKALYKCLTNQFDKKVPLAVIAHTIKGFGVKQMEHNPAWHHKTPTEDEYKSFMLEGV